MTEAIVAGQFDLLEQTVEKFQRASQTLKYAQVPTVAAVQGMALGGGCEFVMHAGKRVMALESYIGLVEAGVGLIPAGGGCKEFAVRAADWAAQSNVPGEVFNYLQNAFMTIAMAKVATSAVEAVDFGFAKPSDTILFNANELLFVAIREARAMADAGYAPPPMPRAIPVAGKNGIATFEMMLVNMKEGGMISAHDYKVARSAAIALCGGEVETGSLVDEEWLITVERRLFVELLKNPLTQARIKHADTESSSPRRQRKMSKQIQDAYIVAATRLPVAKKNGMFRNVRPDDMLAHVIKSVVAQVPGIDPALIGDVIVGCAMPEAEQGMNVARIGLLLAGLPITVPGITINRFCSSGVPMPPT